MVYHMNIQAVAELSAELIIKYYDNDYMPFLSYMDKDALWYGPAKGQFIHGRERMIELWNAEEHDLRFSLGNMDVEHTTSNHSFCNVILTFYVTTHYPDNNDITLYQRIVLTWCERIFRDASGERVRKPSILVCDISNPHSKHDDDTIYPTNFQKIYHQDHLTANTGRRIHFHGTDRSDHFILSDTVLYIESAHGGKHSILHNEDDTVEVMLTIAAIEKKYGHLFLRCHQSYLVNPKHIENICRFKVTLTDGTELPVPEKKYTAFRDKARKSMKK